MGEDDWLREGQDGVRELQQALQLEVEVRIKIHKVSFACRPTSCMRQDYSLACSGVLPHATG